MSSHRDLTNIRVLEGNADLEREDTIISTRKVRAPESAPASSPSSQDKRQIEEIQNLNAELSGRIAALEQSIASIRITGPGFSGQGPRGIMFSSDNLASSAGGSAGLFDAVLCINGTLTNVMLSGTVGDPV